MQAAYSAGAAGEAFYNEQLKSILEHYRGAETAAAGIFSSTVRKLMKQTDYNPTDSPFDILVLDIREKKDRIEYCGYEPMVKSQFGDSLPFIGSPIKVIVRVPQKNREVLAGVTDKPLEDGEEDDRKPSFSVSTTRNIWNDFGTGKAGDVIDFAVEMGGGFAFREAVGWLEDIMGRPEAVNPANDWRSCPPDSHQAVIEDTRVEPLKHNALIKYLGSRNIPQDIGMKYCKEVHYTVGERRFFGLCFMNILGGMEIRSASFKGCHGVKAPSVIQVSKERRTPACCVFEGFMDFLSYMTLWERGDESIVQDVPCDCIVTNSTSLVRKGYTFALRKHCGLRRAILCLVVSLK